MFSDYSTYRLLSVHPPIRLPALALLDSPSRLNSLAPPLASFSPYILSRQVHGSLCSLNRVLNCAARLSSLRPTVPRRSSPLLRLRCSIPSLSSPSSSSAMLSSSRSQYTRQGTGLVPSTTATPSPSPCPSAAATPRSILKCTTPQPTRPHPHPHPSVRFPSSPKLSTVHITHCSTSYDRTPITIGPNSCALPERGTRSYSPGGSSSSPVTMNSMQWGNHVHPSVLARHCAAYAASASEPTFELFPPPLLHDSESSEDSGQSSPSSVPCPKALTD